MARYGVDNWCWRMEQHKRKGHHILTYREGRYRETEGMEAQSIPDTQDAMVTHEKSIHEHQQDLLVKERRLRFWERYHEVPTTEELIWGRLEATV